MPDAAVTVYNHDIVGFWDKFNRFIEEVYRAQSSNTSQFYTFDQQRLTTYLDAIVRWQNWVTEQPLLDLPETSPRMYTLKAAPVVTDTENDEVDNILRLLLLGRDELVNSQSARMGSGLIQFDSNRLSALISKCQTFMSTFVQTSTPLDLPESSPQTLVTGPGRGGV